MSTSDQDSANGMGIEHLTWNNRNTNGRSSNDVCSMDDLKVHILQTAKFRYPFSEHLVVITNTFNGGRTYRSVLGDVRGDKVLRSGGASDTVEGTLTILLRDLLENKDGRADAEMVTLANLHGGASEEGDTEGKRDGGGTEHPEKKSMVLRSHS